ncbi:NAD-dependent epimerase/dehydratase family protein [Thermasporomyces composti]|jgi:hypothetical protein|uniref:Uronate dehydrogenase n=1 Tax=Thermasporomyces composti TaxID=696763 RepID=A0A3D9V950_THECX|nr:NAD(P)-dependent oxidoreductase [Thermasporomyces composti]REF36690.1 uronate dehydrogenase [Thermasporomyces composti]
MTQRSVLVTGAAGHVARLLMPGLGDYSLRLVDQRRPDPDVADVADVRLGSVVDRAFVAEVLDGVDTVVHLAANPSPTATWDALSAPNVDAVAVVLQAAVEAGVRRVVLASSVHAMGAYVQREQHPVDPSWPPSPCCPYGASKAFGEALGRTYSYRTGLSVICLRFGGVQPRPFSVGGLASWLGPADLRQLVVRAIEAEGVSFGVYHGVSANTRSEWDITNARKELGYQPTCDSETFANEVHPTTTRGLCAPGPVAWPLADQ